MEFLNRKNFREINNITFYFSVISFVKIISIIYLSYPIINSIFYRFYLKIIDQSLFPYQDFYFEYPPLLALMTSFPFGLIKIKNEFEYFAYFNFYLIIFELISMKISFKILTKINNNQIELLKEKRFYLTWAVLTSCLCFFVYQCLEYISVFIMVLTILFSNDSNSKYNFKLYLLSIVGIFTKIICSLNLPLAIFFIAIKNLKICQNSYS